MSAWGTRYGGPLEPADVNALVTWIRGLSDAPKVELPRTPVRGDVGNGAKLYAEHCAACHGERGQGKDGPTLNDALFHVTASDAFIRYAIEHGRGATPMPAFGSRLSSTELDDLTAFVRSLRQNQTRQQPVAEVPKGPLVINPKGAHPDFTLRDEFYVPADEVKKALDDGRRLIIVDARAKSDYLEAHIPGALSVPFYSVETYAEKLPKDGTWIVAYCACPHAASGRVAQALRDRGFEHAVVLDEGIHVWTQRGYPTKKAE
jgi:rhodanese-related sulfurtransferase/mono/diheme cytochrome c family protein